MNNQDNSIALKTFIEGCITALADEHFQEESQSKAQWEKWATYDEVYMNFCSWCEPIIHELLKYNLPSKQISAINELSDLIEAFDDTNSEISSKEDYKRILKNPKWKEIQEQAKRIKKMFAKQTDDRQYCL